MKTLKSQKLVTVLLMAALVTMASLAVMATSDGDHPIISFSFEGLFGKISFGSSGPSNNPPPPPGSIPGQNPGPGLVGGPPSPPPSQPPSPEQPSQLFSRPPAPKGGKAIRDVGNPVMYVNSYGQTIAAVPLGCNAALYVRGQGNIYVEEWVWMGWPFGWQFHDSAFQYNPGPSEWVPFWFFADYVGATPWGTWHALRARIGWGPGSVYTSWVFIFVIRG